MADGPMEGDGKMVSGILQHLWQHDPAALALTLVEGRQQRVCWRFHDLYREQSVALRLLQRHGVRKSDCIVVIAGNSPHYIALLLAAMRLDCCFVPINPDVSAHLLQTVLQQVRPCVTIVEQGAATRFVLQTRQFGCTVLKLRPGHTTWLRHILVCPGRRMAMPVSQQSAGAPAVSVPANTVLLLYSSGSTGIPKAICYTRTTLPVFLHWQRRLFAAFPDQPQTPAAKMPSARINVLPLAHFGGLSFCLQALLEGRAVHLLRHHSAEDYLALAQHSGCQLLLMVPALYEQLYEHLVQIAPAGQRCSRVRYCLTLGEAISSELTERIEQTLGVRVYSTYGMSEALSGIGHAAGSSHKLIPAGSCGQLLFGEAQLRDRAGNIAASEGELCIRNATTTPCYLDPALNQRCFEQGWYRTGDLFRRDGKGYFYYQGRIDDLCIVNGRNLYPQEVEAVLQQHPMVQACLAAPLQLADGRQRLGALVVISAGSRLTVAELLDFHLAWGALHTIPAWVVICPALPRNATGKHDRKAAAHWLQQDYQGRRQPVPRQGDIAVCSVKQAVDR